jgi:hypothetical protein
MKLLKFGGYLIIFSSFFTYTAVGAKGWKAHGNVLRVAHRKDRTKAFALVHKSRLSSIHHHDLSGGSVQFNPSFDNTEPFVVV